MITVCIIEDIEDIREGLKEIIESDKRFEILKCFANAEDALVEIPSLLPKIVISDINLPQKSGIDCVSEINLIFPEILFIMFTIYEDDEKVFEALKKGAKGYILKNTEPSKIIDSLIELNDGGSPMSPKIARKVLDTFKQQIVENEFQKLITKRELEVLEFLSKGFLYKEIADKLDIALSTVKRHLNNIYSKLQVQNKTEAINKFFGK